MTDFRATQFNVLPTVFQTPDVPLPETPDPLVDITSALSDDTPQRKLSESIDVVGGTGTTPNVSLSSPNIQVLLGIAWLMSRVLT